MSSASTPTMSIRYSLIAAHSQHRVIGHNNQLLWHLSADLKRFKALTLNKSILMGRKTYESIGRPLPQRQNIVLTRQSNLNLPSEVKVIRHLDELPQWACDQEVMVIGGQQIYELTLPLASTLHITQVFLDLKGDAYFPDYHHSHWQLIEQSQKHTQAEPHIDYQYLTYHKAT